MAQITDIKNHALQYDNDTNILMDLDLSILGRGPKEYEKYSENIRKEYIMYPDVMYQKGRKDFLKNILALDSIYKTDFFKQKFEVQARMNLRLELNQLN